MPKTSTQLILSERREPRARLCSKQLTINNVDDRKEAKKIGKSSSSGVKTHNCLQFGRQILEFAALCILQHLVIRNTNQLHMPTEDLCRWAELLTNGGFWSSIFNLVERGRRELSVWSRKMLYIWYICLWWKRRLFKQALKHYFKVVPCENSLALRVIRTAAWIKRLFVKTSEAFLSDVC